MSELITAYTCGVCKNILDEPATHYEGDPRYAEHRSQALGSPWGVLMANFAELETMSMDEGL